jgi:phage-related protein
MSLLWDIGLVTSRGLAIMHNVEIHPAARKQIKTWPIEIKKELGVVLMRLQRDETIGMPDVRRMASVSKSACEIRLQGKDGAYRTFFVLVQAHGVIVFHAFKKKTQKTPMKEMETARKRLKEILEDLEG